VTYNLPAGLAVPAAVTLIDRSSAGSGSFESVIAAWAVAGTNAPTRAIAAAVDRPRARRDAEMVPYKIRPSGGTARRANLDGGRPRLYQGSTDPHDERPPADGGGLLTVRERTIVRPYEHAVRGQTSLVRFELIENAKPDVILAQRSVLRVVLGRQRNGPLLNVLTACRRSQS